MKEGESEWLLLKVCRVLCTGSLFQTPGACACPQEHDTALARAQAALATSAQESAAARGELQRQVNELSAKVAEAAGALRAKEELKEER